MDYIILSFYGTGVILPFVMIFYLFVRLLLNGSSQVLLCMECDQCVSVCPMAKKYPDAASPRDMMIAAKNGTLVELYENGLIRCNFCGACEKKCPRGLSPYKELEKMMSHLPDHHTTEETVDIAIRKNSVCREQRLRVM